MKKIFNSFCALLVCLCLQGGVANADEIGVPTEGSMGVTLTVKELMDAKLLRPLEEQRAFYPPPKKQKIPGGGELADPKWVREQVAPPTSIVTPATARLGLQFTSHKRSPPDTSAALGPTQYIVTVNSNIRSFDKVTGLQDGALDIYTGDFFKSQITPMIAPSYAFISDPRVRYDRLSRRWIIMMIDVPVVVDASGGTTYGPNRIMIAVSSGPIITNKSSFTFFNFQSDLVGPTPNLDTGTLADYPTLGIDANALYIGVNTYAQNNGLGPTVFVIRKSSVLAAGPIVVTAFRQLGTYTLQGVDNYDPNATEGYFISAYYHNILTVLRIGTPGGTPTLSSANVYVPNYYWYYSAPHLGSTAGDLSIAGDRLYAAHIRNGRLWIVHNVLADATGTSSATGDRGASRWYEIKDVSTATPSVVQSGTFFDAAATNPKSHYLPSLMVSGQGHVVVGINTSGKADYINSAVTQRFASDPPNSMQALTPYTAAATACNGDLRWGDYTDSTLDPEDDMTIWVIQKYCGGTDSPDMRVAQVLAPPPPPNLSAAPNSVAQGQASVNIVITGSGVTATGGQGFYDPGAGFSKRLAVDIPGGVTVNSVTYTSPTQITLNVSTVSTPAGNKNVKVTNPDGQAVTGPFVINVTATPLTPQSITFPAVTAFSWYQGSATLAAAASSGLTVSYSVVSGPCLLASNILTATQPGACVVAANQPGNITVAAAAQQTQAVTINVGPMLLDIDASNTATRYNAATDGVMILRYLAGYTGSALTVNATGSSATRNTAQIEAHLATLRPFMNVDGDGAVLASTDGVLIVRYLLGLRGSTLVQGVNLGSTTSAQIEANIARLMP
jgi:hypothetical protein